MLSDPRVFARVSASAAAAAAQALADGHRVGVWQEGVLYWQLPDGTRMAVDQAVGQHKGKSDEPRDEL